MRSRNPTGSSKSAATVGLRRPPTPRPGISTVALSSAEIEALLHTATGPVPPADFAAATIEMVPLDDAVDEAAVTSEVIALDRPRSAPRQASSLALGSGAVRQKRATTQSRGPRRARLSLSLEEITPKPKR